jgi:hypothetical protein
VLPCSTGGTSVAPSGAPDFVHRSRRAFPRQSRSPSGAPDLVHRSRRAFRGARGRLPSRSRSPSLAFHGPRATLGSGPYVWATKLDFKVETRVGSGAGPSWVLAGCRSVPGPNARRSGCVARTGNPVALPVRSWYELPLVRGTDRTSLRRLVRFWHKLRFVRRDTATSLARFAVPSIAS